MTGNLQTGAVKDESDNCRQGGERGGREPGDLEPEIFTLATREMLDIASRRAKIPLNSQLPEGFGPGAMNNIQPTNTTHSYPQSEAMSQTCRHPRVQVVSRDEDAEFLECLECREIFESSEFRDMDIEAKIPTEEE
jgi:seryl-tRNA(Sec) selenium transferase